MKSPPFILCDPPPVGYSPLLPDTNTRSTLVLRVFPCLQGSARPLDRRFLFLPVLRRHTGRTESSAPTAFLRREALSLREAQRRGNPFSARRRRADGTSGTPSPSLIHSPIHHRGLFQFSVPSFRSNSAWMRRRSTACSGAVRRGSAAIRVWAASRASARSGISQLRSAAFSVGRPC